MRKLFKILPVVAAVVPLTTVPFVTTSCKTDKYEDFKYVFDDTHKAKDFEPTDSLGHVRLHAQEVTRTFIEKINEKKSILADTICYSIINDFFLTDEAPEVDFTKATGEIKVSIGKLDSKTSRCTVKYSFDLFVDSDEHIASVEFDNIPFSVYEWFDTRELKWCFAPVYSMMVMACDMHQPAPIDRQPVYNNYLKYVNDWNVSIDISSKALSDIVSGGNISLKVGNTSQELLKYFLYSDLCLYTHTFTKINFLKDIEIIEG